MQTSVCVHTPRTCGGCAPAVPQVLSDLVLLSACCRPAGHPGVFRVVSSCSFIPRFFVTLTCQESKCGAGMAYALAAKDRRDLSYFRIACLANLNRHSAISTALSGVKVASAPGVSSSLSSIRKYTSEGAGQPFTVTSATPTVRVEPSCLNDLHGKNTVFSCSAS